MLDMIKNMILHQKSFQEAVDLLLEDDELDDSIVLGEEDDIPMDDGGSDDVGGPTEIPVSDAEPAQEDAPEVEDDTEPDEQPEPSLDGDDLPTPMGLQTGEPAQAGDDDILGVTLDLATNTQTDTLPIPPKDAADAIDGGSDKHYVDAGFGGDEPSGDVMDMELDDDDDTPDEETGTEEPDNEEPDTEDDADLGESADIFDMPVEDWFNESGSNLNGLKVVSALNGFKELASSSTNPVKETAKRIVALDKAIRKNVVKSVKATYKAENSDRSLFDKLPRPEAISVKFGDNEKITKSLSWAKTSTKQAASRFINSLINEYKKSNHAKWSKKCRLWIVMVDSVGENKLSDAVEKKVNELNMKAFKAALKDEIAKGIIDIQEDEVNRVSIKKSTYTYGYTYDMGMGMQTTTSSVQNDYVYTFSYTVHLNMNYIFDNVSEADTEKFAEFVNMFIDDDFFTEAISVGEPAEGNDATGGVPATDDNTAGSDVSAEDSTAAAAAADGGVDDTGEPTPEDSPVTAAVKDKVAEMDADTEGEEGEDVKEALLKKLGNLTKSIEDTKKMVMDAIKY